MNRRQSLVQEHFLDREEVIIKRLNSVYAQSLRDINAKVKELEFNIRGLTEQYDWMDDDDPEKEKVRSKIQSKIYQKQYQEQLQKQVDGILNQLQEKQYTNIADYLDECYSDAFVGSIFDMHGQGVPLMMPIDQESMIRAVQTDSKISNGLYSRLGEDVNLLKKKITAQVSRSISTGMTFAQTAQQLAGYTKIGLNNSMRIVRTEGHRIQCTAAMDACYQAKERGADVVKQWDATLDARTRESHTQVDGEIRELDEKFSNGLMFPGDPAGGAAEVVNCRCALLQRARWALDDAELQTLKDRASYYGLDKSEQFGDFKKKYLKSVEKPEKPVENPDNSAIIQAKNKEVREWYVDQVSKIPEGIDPSLPIEEQAKQAFEVRNAIRTQARNMMPDQEVRAKLDKEHPNKTFEELINSKMERKGLTREEAIQDIYNTATKTNANVNRELGIGGD